MPQSNHSYLEAPWAAAPVRQKQGSSWAVLLLRIRSLLVRKGGKGGRKQTVYCFTVILKVPDYPWSQHTVFMGSLQFIVLN